MKLVVCDGATLTVRDVGPVLIEVTRRAPDGPPIKAHGSRLLEDEDARAELRALLASGLYDHRRLT